MARCIRNCIFINEFAISVNFSIIVIRENSLMDISVGKSARAVAGIFQNTTILFI